MTVRFIAMLSLLPMLAATAQPADLVVTNGRIVTVDERFSIHEALAVRDGRILAVGSDREVRRHVDASTRVIDLQQQTVIPGLIDNHVHIIRGSRQWPSDVRLDGVHSREEARRLIAERARELGPGRWVVVLGGYTPHQFSDDRSAFTRQELDEVAPDNPVFVQLLFGTGSANTRAFRAIGIDEDTEIVWLDIANDIDLDDDEQPTGVVRGAAMRRMLAKLVEPDPEQARERALGLVGT